MYFVQRICAMNEERRGLELAVRKRRARQDFCLDEHRLVKPEVHNVVEKIGLAVNLPQFPCSRDDNFCRTTTKTVQMAEMLNPSISYPISASAEIREPQKLNIVGHLVLAGPRAAKVHMSAAVVDASQHSGCMYRAMVGPVAIQLNTIRAWEN